LIIEDNLAVSRQRFERLQVIMPGARSAVQEQQGDAATAYPAIPDLIAINANGPFLNVHGVPFPRGRSDLYVSPILPRSE